MDDAASFMFGSTHETRRSIAGGNLATPGSAFSDAEATSSGSKWVRSGAASSDMVNKSMELIEKRVYVLNFQLLGVKNLSVKTSASINPYVILSLLPSKATEPIVVGKSAVIRGTSSPRWDETFEIGEDEKNPVKGGETLLISIFDWDLSERSRVNDVLLGRVQHPISSYASHLGEDISDTLELTLPSGKVTGGLEVKGTLRRFSRKFLRGESGAFI